MSDDCSDKKLPVDRYIKKILDARVYDVAIESPITHAQLLSKRFDNHIYLKREDLQPVFSFKLRGACWDISNKVRSPMTLNNGRSCRSAISSR